MSEEKKNVTGNEAAQDEKEQGTDNQASGNNEEIKKEGFLKKVGNGVKNNWKKALIPIGVVAGFAAGVVAEKSGFKFKKNDGPAEETTDQQ
jgi:isopentenyl diphosphate isomerase/L-lactate dehydrogenase-like FMN-dependent dehydrogenase